MKYIFLYTTDISEGPHNPRSIHLSNAPMLLDSDLCSIAKIMERNGQFYGQRFRIQAIGIQSDYLSPRTPMRMLYL